MAFLAALSVITWQTFIDAATQWPSELHQLAHDYAPTVLNAKEHIQEGE